MKKKITLLLVLVLVFVLALALTGCGNKTPYSDYDLSEYITLPDYNTFITKVPSVAATSDDIDKEIEERLDAQKTTTEVTEGTVEDGSVLKINYEGTLEDGSKPNTMKADNASLTIGSKSFIDGFESGLIGHKVGETVKLDLHFPDPYENDTALSGKAVTFEVKIVSMSVTTTPKFDTDFIQKDSNGACKTEVEYRDYIKKAVEQEKYDEALYDIKCDLYDKIVDGTTATKYPEKELNAQIKELNETYKQVATNYGADWATFLSQYLGVDQEAYDQQVESYAKELIKQEMVVYQIAKLENIELTDKEFDKYVSDSLLASGFEDEKAFKEYAGMSVKEYCEKYKLRRDLLLTKVLDVIQDRLVNAGQVEE